MREVEDNLLVVENEALVRVCQLMVARADSHPLVLHGRRALPVPLCDGHAHGAPIAEVRIVVLVGPQAARLAVPVAGDCNRHVAQTRNATAFFFFWIPLRPPPPFFFPTRSNNNSLRTRKRRSPSPTSRVCAVTDLPSSLSLSPSLPPFLCFFFPCRVPRSLPPTSCRVQCKKKTVYNESFRTLSALYLSSGRSSRDDSSKVQGTRPTRESKSFSAAQSLRLSLSLSVCLSLSVALSLSLFFFFFFFVSLCLSAQENVVQRNENPRYIIQTIRFYIIQ